MHENDYTQKLIKVLNSITMCRAKKRHGGKFQQGDADIAGCYFGKSFFIEVKLLNGELTKLQAEELTKWHEAGALTALAIWVPEKKWFKVIEPRTLKFGLT